MPRWPLDPDTGLLKNTPERLAQFRASAKRLREQNPGASAAKQRVYRLKNLERIRQQERQRHKRHKDLRNAQQRNRKIARPELGMINACKAVAKKRGLPFDLVEADIKIPSHCPILGIKLERGSGQRTNASPSIDRITPKLGYVRGNVIVVSWEANNIKGNAHPLTITRVGKGYESILGIGMPLVA